jgi:uncharacterized membrane protein
MLPIMRIVLPLIGIVAAGMLGSPASRPFELVLGAFVGFLIADLGILRAQFRGLCKDLEQLVAEMRRRAATPIAPDALPSATIESPKTAEVRAPQVVDVKLDEPSPLPWKEFDDSSGPIGPGPAAASSSRASAMRPPSPESPVVAAIRNFFTGGNTLVRVGVIVLFFGVAFLLRYMAEHSHIPIEVRLTGVALASMVLIVFGWRLRLRRTGYALSLQGGGVGILYLIVFAALRLYKILPPEIAFPLLVIIAIISAMLAVLQDSMWFALLAVSGGFLAPVLASSGEGSHVVLFSYYAVLNAGILAVAWFKAWRALNVAGFVFTFAIAAAWGILKYDPKDFVTTEPFLILFFLFYFGISILFTLRQTVKLTGYIDSALIFGMPIVAFSLQSAMLHDRLMSLAYSAIALSALYLLTAWALKRRRSKTQALLIEAFIALGVAFLTLAIPLALDARWNAATWALEGAALVWIGCRQNRVLARLFGALLSVAAGCVVLEQFDRGGPFTLSLGAYFGILVQSVAALFSARTLISHRQKLKELESLVPDALYCWGIGFWLLGGFGEIRLHFLAVAMAAALLLVTITALASTEIHRRTDLGAARILSLLQLPAMWGFAAFAAFNAAHPASHGGWWAWPAAFAGMSWVMFRLEGPSRSTLANSLNAGATWLFCALFSWEAAWQIGARLAAGDTWKAAAWALIPAAFLWWLPHLVTRVKWPFAKNREAYLFVAGVGVAVYLALWSLITNLSCAGDTAPLTYVPLLNALDILQAAVLLILLRYWRFLKSVSSPGFGRMNKRLPLATLAALTFVALNAVLLRTLHQSFGVALQVDQLMASTLVQTSISLFWAVLALAAMMIATRKRNRMVWLVGAVLLGIVIAKLFLIDLSRIGSVERIISFVGVGLLMLIVGYFSPLPPARESHP